MPTPTSTKSRKMSPESVKAGDRLLKGIKDRLAAQGAKVDEQKLHQDGYSDAMIARLKKA
jgi:hypothetical protein